MSENVKILGCTVPKGESLLGARSYNKDGCGLTVISRLEGKPDTYICLLDSGVTFNIMSKEIRSGGWKDPMFPIKYGKGFLGVGDHKAKVNGKHTSAYETWSGIIRRCYDEDYPYYYRYGGSGAYVVDEWFNFQNFAGWFYSEVAKYPPDARLSIDKDLKGGFCYSPDNSIMLPYKLNSFITNSKTDDGLVGYVKPKQNKWTVTLSVLGKQHFIGDFEFREEGDYVYRVLRQWVYRLLADKYMSHGYINQETHNLLCNVNTEFSEDTIIEVKDKYSGFVSRVENSVTIQTMTERVKKIPVKSKYCQTQVSR